MTGPTECPSPDETTARDINVEIGADDRWLVSRGRGTPPLGRFRRQAMALAFAKALAFSRGGELTVRDATGQSVRHTRASLTYPVELA